MSFAPGGSATGVSFRPVVATAYSGNLDFMDDDVYPREREIMEHVRQGQRNAEIAASRFIAVGTVKRHLDHVYDKLGARTRVEAIARYAEMDTADGA